MGLRSVALTLVCASLPATAASPPPAPVAPQDEAAQQAFRAGVDAARQEHWIDARTSFERAYSLSPRPVVLINLAGAQARTGRLTEAAKNYRRILGEDGSPETASFRRAAAEVLPELEARIPRVRLRPTGLSPTDVIQIDEAPVEIEEFAGGHPLDPGEHTLVVTHDGAERARVLFRLAEREQRDITLPLPTLVPRQTRDSPPLVDVPSTVPGPAAEPREPRRWWQSPWTWTAVAAAVVGGTVTAFVIYEHRDQPFVGSIPPGQVSVR